MAYCMVHLNSSFSSLCLSEKLSIASPIISLIVALVSTFGGAKLIEIGPEVVVWTVTVVISLHMASCEVG